MFSLNEMVVYPGYGVAKINRVIEKKVAGSSSFFYELKFLNKDMIILVPVSNMEGVGIRELSSKDHINTILKFLSEPVAKGNDGHPVSNWNKRNKKYQEDIRRGNLESLCKIYRDLKHMSTYKDLSFGEKALLHQTESMIAQEVSLVRNIKEDTAIEHLRSITQFRTLIHAASSSSLKFMGN